MPIRQFAALCAFADYAARRKGGVGIKLLRRLYRSEGFDDKALDARAVRDAENALIMTGNLDAPL